MKINRLPGIACVFSFLVLLTACGERKERDVRKLNWYEISTDARGKQVVIAVPREEESYWRARFQRDQDSSINRISIEITVVSMDQQTVLDSLDAGTKTSLMLLRGDNLKRALDRDYLFGPFDRLLPATKSMDTSVDEFRYSEGVLSQGFAIPLPAQDSLSAGFFAIPKEANYKAASLFVLEKMLEQEIPVSEE